MSVSAPQISVKSPSSPYDKCLDSGVRLGEWKYDDTAEILEKLETILGVDNVSADPKDNKHYRKGWRSGEGSALAVLFPKNLSSLWQAIKCCVAYDCIIIMQAANTGLTEGSTPNNNDYDRPVVVINTLALNDVYLINEGYQVVCHPGATLHKLESMLADIGRTPHSVIGSSCLGASVIGGIANNSGGALVKRGPAYTECALFAQINDQGQLLLSNHLGLDLGDDPDAIIQNLSIGNFDSASNDQGSRLSCDTQYTARIRDITSDTPSRYNANPDRLFEASGCAGKLAIFAVRVDSHKKPQAEKTFYIGTNDPAELTQLRRSMLSDLHSLPDVAEYMHKDIFEVSEKYGKDTFLSVKYLGTQRLPKLFALKSRIDSALNDIHWLPNDLSDKSMQMLSRLLPQHLPPRLLKYKDKYEHHLILKVSDDAIAPTSEFLVNFFADSSNGDYFECDAAEAQGAVLNRFAAAGAALRFQLLNKKRCGDILALDIALKRSEQDWFEHLPPDIDAMIEKKLYYGHFFCYVFHQDYILKASADAKLVKQEMLKLLDNRGAKYPAEHNVGHLYSAETELQQFYQTLDPTNTFNPGVGKMDKTKRNCGCC
ncbi:D-lactate dehydrogenase [Glaciecola sp. 1036]|uniref:D-lactate dehydrogenase n=1 Tax=Alteromonadaceae TaxID=72275 RepID=UPI003CFC3786